MSPQYLNLDWLKERCDKIHYFGLGFIQIKLKNYDGVAGLRRRVHVYDWRNLPPITSKEEIHNHRYSFTSHILKGEFEQSIYSVVEGDDCLLEKESCKAGVEINEPRKLCSARYLCSQVFQAGSSYNINHKAFHKVEAYNAVTLLEIGDVQKDFAEVIRPVGDKKVCPFSANLPESELWDIVEKILAE